MPKMINIASTGAIKYYRLANKTKQKYSFFGKLSLAVIVSCEVDKNPHIFLTRENQHIQEINRYFDGTLYHFGPMVFASNEEKK